MQLELLRLPERIVARTPEQEANFRAFQTLREEAKREVIAMEEIGRRLYPDDFDRLVNTSNERLKAICIIYHNSKGLDVEAIWAQKNFVPPANVEKPIRRWSLEAKRRNRLNKIHKRLTKKYSIAELFHQAIQSKILENPNYYGVCPLPTEFASTYYPPYRSSI